MVLFVSMFCVMGRICVFGWGGCGRGFDMFDNSSNVRFCLYFVVLIIKFGKVLLV